MSHTPGPWTVSTSPDYFPSGATVVRANGGVVVAVLTKTPHIHANARLIASAPDLLEKLEAAELAIKACDDTGFYSEFRADIRTVIKAARGL